MENNSQPSIKRRLTKQQKVSLVAAGVLLAIAIGIIVAMRQGDAVIVKSGIETSATSDGGYMQTREGGRRGKTVYKARYEFTVDGNRFTVYGEKGFDTKDKIVEGVSVQVKYLADDPLKAVVISSE